MCCFHVSISFDSLKLTLNVWVRGQMDGWMDERMDGKKRHILLLLFITFTFPLLMYTNQISAN